MLRRKRKSSGKGRGNSGITNYLLVLGPFRQDSASLPIRFCGRVGQREGIGEDISVAARKGNAKAQETLRWMYQNGKGVT